MKYYHRNYFFLLTASALTTVLWSLTYTTSRYRTRFSPMMEVDGIAEMSGFVENIGPVSYTHLDVYKRQVCVCVCVPGIYIVIMLSILLKSVRYRPMDIWKYTGNINTLKK